MYKIYSDPISSFFSNIHNTELPCFTSLESSTPIVQLLWGYDDD